jgi:hypothetical protein
MNLDASKTGAALFGTQVGGLLCAALTYYFHVPLSGEVKLDIIGLCVFLASHLIRPTTPVDPAKVNS